ncbi:MAG: threonine--tRNA ligase [Candidatus Coatesbacteria bacterium]|nr:threonine--tRNA ligase [Candidatus Coatesbacteria bacterium]
MTIDLDKYRHSTAHLLADAVLQLFPGTKLGIGPAIENGFYYDFDRDVPFSDADFESIEAKMRDIVSRDLPFERQVVTREEALALFSSLGQDYKLDLINNLPSDEEITVYRHGDFVDLCLGPHVSSTGELGVFKLISVAGAYWLGDEKNPMLQRIYGAAFATQEQLDEYLKKLEEAKLRDHRILGKQLELFSIDEQVGAGLVYWHPNGATIKREIERFWEDEHLKRGYDLLSTPHIAKSKLWEISGHYGHYKENMYIFPVGNEEYVLKPMNCPMHLQVYKSRIRSYRELPIRFAELGTVYRRERSGTLHGLFRVRGYTCDDAHIFCSFDQVEEEIGALVEFSQYFVRCLGFENLQIELSLMDPAHPEHYIGSPEVWERSQATLRHVLQSKSLEFIEIEGEAAFYGPKIDFQLIDVYGHKQQGSTIQLDFNLPERFDLKYVNSSGGEEYVALLHNAILGSIERFMAAFIENYGGAFPMWVSPVQVALLPITDAQLEFASQIHEELKDSGLRVYLDDRNEKLGFKIREHSKVPYQLVIGKKEVESSCVSVRHRSRGQIGTMTSSEFKSLACEEVQNRVIS